jgi:hypothetical protein
MLKDGISGGKVLKIVRMFILTTIYAQNFPNTSYYI